MNVPGNVFGPLKHLTPTFPIFIRERYLASFRTGGFPEVPFQVREVISVHSGTLQGVGDLRKPVPDEYLIGDNTFATHPYGITIPRT